MCEARQYSDQMLCDRCGLQWDVNDPEPPECSRQSPQERRREYADERLRRIFALLDE